MKPAVSLLTGSCLFVITGCASSLLNSTAMEQRVVEQFTDALAEENEPALRRITSSNFEQKALQSEDVLRDLEVMHLPSGKVSVVEVAKEENGRREVIVKEEDGGKFQFHLVKDPVKKYWVVDDVMVRQRTRGTRATKSTSEVMELLVTLRRFLGVWESGDRAQILAMTSGDLTQSLSPLPDPWLKSLAGRIASNYEDGMARKPEANLDESNAVVKLPAKNGHILLSIVRESDRWLVDDVEAHNRREQHHPGSVKRQANAINAVNAFLTAYSREDHDALGEIADRKFYESSLKLADLSLVSLPKTSEIPAEYDIRAFEDQLTFMIPAGRQIVRMDLVEEANGLPTPASGFRKVSRFSIKDVKLYDRSTDRQQSLATIFTAPTRASLFLTALQDADLGVLSQSSTPTFSKSTWKRVNPNQLSLLQVPKFDVDGLKLVNSHSLGNVTELEFKDGSGRLLSCRMLNQSTGLRVDDVQYPDEDGNVVSLKSRLELSIPMMEFAAAWRNRDMKALQAASSSDFNRLVWSHVAEVPVRFGHVTHRLNQPITETKMTPERATVRLGSGESQALTASLVMEHDFWVVDEVKFNDDAMQVVGIRDSLRKEISAQLLSGSYSQIHASNGHDVVVPLGSSGASNNSIQQVTGTMNSATSSVTSALYQRSKSPGAELGMVKPAVHEQAALLRNENSAKSRSGVQVFGPQAEEVANEFDAMLGSTAANVKSIKTAAIDMTEPDLTPPADNMMHFGPDKDKLAATVQQPANGIRQPSDMPISID